MKDVRERAEEKARDRLNETVSRQDMISPNTGLESERYKAKQALRQEVNTYNGQDIRKIAAGSEQQNNDRILRVAAYCRVSTDDIDQVISIELQKSNYSEMIRRNPKWRYAGTYVDDGFSGTNTDHRPAFQLMMRDAIAGKIDMIITKSVSRFARNLLDCISWVRKLQEQDPPIAVFFEQENLNTLEATSNIILFVLAMVAEEESHMKSEAMLLSLEWRFSRGRFLTPGLLGYDYVEVSDGHGGHKKELVINEDEARTVRLMYYMLLNGSSTSEIAETLTELKRETGARKMRGIPNTHWTATGVSSVLRNERYCGDVLARKTWTPNFHDHKSKRNNGKKNKYYQHDHHEAIVSRAQWNAAQHILNSHRYSHTGSYLPMRVVTNGTLKGFISINRSWAGYEADEYYRVCEIAMGLRDGELKEDLAIEHLPDGGRRIAGITDDNSVQRIARMLSQAEQNVKAQLEGYTAPEEDEVRKPMPEGFQVARADMFSHAYDPVVKFTAKSIAFSSTCVNRLGPSSDTAPACTEYVEILLNPAERILAVRPCTEGYVNAIHWADANGKGKNIGASAFCRLLYGMLGWDESYCYRVPCVARARNGARVLLFDLDNYIGSIYGDIRKRKAGVIAEAKESIRRESEETKGIFYGADSEEAQEVVDTEDMERRLAELAEIERMTFGTPLFEHNDDVRLSTFGDDADWDIAAEAIPLDEDHHVSEEIVEALHYELAEDLTTVREEAGGSDGEQ